MIETIRLFFYHQKMIHLYGQILDVLYKHPQMAMPLKLIYSLTGKPSESYMLKTLKELTDEGLIIEEEKFVPRKSKDGLLVTGSQRVRQYRISYKGFQYINQQKESSRNRWFSMLAIIISVASVIASVVVPLYTPDEKQQVNITVTPDTVYIKQDTLLRVIPLKTDTLKSKK